MVERISEPLSVSQLEGTFYSIDFPEYQREPNVWNRDQKQRLIDSMLREFDISAIYLYIRDDRAEFECVDGRQRLNAIMSFLGKNPDDEEDNGFPLRFDNEVTDATPHPFADLNGRTFAELTERSDERANSAVQAFRSYELNVVQLAGFEDADFNLQFLRLNLGTLINAGEKLNAMVGRMHDELFKPQGIGHHPFFSAVRIPTRRFAKELTAAQVVLQAFSFARDEGFSRARHYDLQRFVKENAEEIKDPLTLANVTETLTRLNSSFGDVSNDLRNRAIVVSVVLAAWSLKLYESDSDDTLAAFREFVSAFLGRLRWQVERMKEFKVDEHWDYLVEFQRHLTQASVEKPAVKFRHDMLLAQFSNWNQSGGLQGDSGYRTETGLEPPTAS